MAHHVTLPWRPSGGLAISFNPLVLEAWWAVALGQRTLMGLLCSEHRAGAADQTDHWELASASSRLGTCSLTGTGSTLAWTQTGLHIHLWAKRRRLIFETRISFVHNKDRSVPASPGPVRRLNLSDRQSTRTSRAHDTTFPPPAPPTLPDAGLLRGIRPEGPLHKEADQPRGWS